jgi:succinate-semialdehyde dehydrogenase / glutarate-semialdehyde dehydrogenase
VAAAEAAFPAWAARTAYERAGYLYEAHRLMMERADEPAWVMTTEQGKPLRTARIEVQYAADFLIWFAEEAKRVYRQLRASTIPSLPGLTRARTGLGALTSDLPKSKI